MSINQVFMMSSDSQDNRLSVCDRLNLPFSRGLQSLNFSEQYACNPTKQLAQHLEHTGIMGLI